MPATLATSGTLCLILSALAALTYELIPKNDFKPRWTIAAIKGTAVGALALSALLNLSNPLITAGLFLGAIGDIALTRPGQHAFLSGMAAFALGHLAYTAAFLPHLTAPNASQIAVLVVLVLLLASTEIWLTPHTGTLRTPIRSYVAVIGLMAISVTVLLPGPARETIQLGALLFVLSDLLLALRLFRAHSPRSKSLLALTLWPAYWLGQALILLGAMGYSPA